MRKVWSYLGRRSMLTIGLVLGTVMLSADDVAARDDYCSWVVATIFDGGTDDCLICDYGDYCQWWCVHGQQGSC